MKLKSEKSENFQSQRMSKRYRLQTKTEIGNRIEMRNKTSIKQTGPAVVQYVVMTIEKRNTAVDTESILKRVCIRTRAGRTDVGRNYLTLKPEGKGKKPNTEED